MAAMMTTTTSPIINTTAAPRRHLKEDEVTAIFNHVKTGSNAPHLPYQVILVDPHGSKISPPRQQFSDGLYLLCSFTSIHEIPKHLLGLTCDDGPPVTDSFRWHPAGGGSPRNTSLKLRNCYRFTNLGVKMQGIRGYIWTMNKNQRENLQYRLLHVFPEPVGQSTVTKSSRKSDPVKSSTRTRKPLAPRPKSMDNLPLSSITSPSQKKERTTSLEPLETKPPSSSHANAAPVAPPAKAPALSSTMLSHDDVAAIFNSVYKNEKPPPHLMYQVVIAPKTNPNKVQVTPPQLQYKDGIYIVCQDCPEHLQSRLMRNLPPQAVTFRWNASGPRPLNKNVMLRTCNALKKGEGGKGYGKSATVYTKVTKGRENLQYRLLHIHQPIIRIPAKKTTSKSKAATISRIPRTKKRSQGDKENHGPRNTNAKPKKKKKQRPPQVVDLGVNGCQVCGTDGHPKCLMECDGCRCRYVHTFCIGLEELPEGDWYCTTCMSRKIEAATEAHVKGSKASKNSKTHFKLVRCTQNTTEVSTEAARLHDQLGFLIMDSRNASFEQVRAAIADEIDADLLPESDWKFMVASSLGPLTFPQEKEFGSVASFYEKAFGNRLGDGSAQNPFQLSLLCPPLS